MVARDQLETGRRCRTIALRTLRHVPSTQRGLQLKHQLGAVDRGCGAVALGGRS